MRNVPLVINIRKFKKYITLVYNQKTILKSKTVFKITSKKEKN